MSKPGEGGSPPTVYQHYQGTSCLTTLPSPSMSTPLLLPSLPPEYWHFLIHSLYPLILLFSIVFSVLQLIKSRDKEQKLGILFDTNIRKDYTFSNMQVDDGTRLPTGLSTILFFFLFPSLLYLSLLSLSSSPLSPSSLSLLPLPLSSLLPPFLSSLLPPSPSLFPFSSILSLC